MLFFFDHLILYPELYYFFGALRCEGLRFLGEGSAPAIFEPYAADSDRVSAIDVCLESVIINLDLDPTFIT